MFDDRLAPEHMSRSHGLVVGLEGGRRAVVPAEVGCTDSSIDAQPQRLLLVVQYAGQRGRPVVRFMAADQDSGALMVDRVPQPADVGRHYRSAACLRFERDEAEGLVVGRQTDDIGGAIPAEEFGANRVRPEFHHLVDAERPSQRRQGSGPLGLPIMINFNRSRRAGSRLASSATARISTSGAFSGWIRPTNKITCASWATPRLARDFG